jgi:hypothetical protein
MQHAMQIESASVLNTESMFVGDIDERGFLNNLFRKGFTRAKSLSEGHGNSVDAGSENISYHVLREKIKEVDEEYKKVLDQLVEMEKKQITPKRKKFYEQE